MAQRYLPQEENAALPGSRFSASATKESFGGGQAQQLTNIGTAMQNTAEQVQKMAVESQARRDKALTRDVLVQAQTEALEYSKGVYSRQGKDAIDSYPAAQQDFAKMRQKYSRMLENDTQRDLFNTSFDGVALSHASAILDHQEKERKRFEEETLDAQNKTAHDTAVAYRNRAEDISQAEMTILANTAFKYRPLGVDVAKLKQKEALHALHADIVDAFIKDDQPETAIEYIKNNRDRFNEAKLPEIEATAVKAGKNKWAYETAVSLNASGKSLEEQLAAVDSFIKDKDADTVEKLRAEVKQRYEDKIKIDDAKTKQAVEAEWDKMLADPYNYRVPQFLPADAQTSMLTYRRKVLDDAVLARGVDVPRTNNSDTMAQLKLLHPTELAKIDRTKIANELNAEEYREFVQLQNNARLDEKSADKEKFYKVRNVTQQGEDAISGIKAFKVSTDQTDRKNAPAKELRNQYYEYFEKRVNLIPEEKRTTDEIAKITKDMLSPVIGLESYGIRFKFQLAYKTSKQFKAGQKFSVGADRWAIKSVDASNDPEIDKIQ